MVVDFVLTSDLWISRNKLGSLSLTIHYIDSNWNLNKRIISFKMLESPHTGYNIANLISEELQYWGITDKIFSITLDNATNNDIAEMFLKEKLSLPLHGTLFRIRCCAHILNIIVQDGLSNLSSSVEKIKDIVRNINSSQARYELYIKCCMELKRNKKNINIDVPHRWNATYLLLDSAIKYKDVLNLYYSHLSQNSRCPLEKIEEHDWMLAELVRDFLKVFDDSTKNFCGVYYPTSCRVIIQLTNICAKFSKFYGQTFGIFDETLDLMRQKFDKYWGDIPLIFGMAIILDPRFKIEELNVFLEIIYNDEVEKIQKTIQSFQNSMTQLFDYYGNAYKNFDIGAQTQNTRSSLSSTSSLSDQEEQNAYHMVKRRREQASSITSGGLSEFQRYLNQPLLEIDEEGSFDLLGWWKTNQSKYPILSIMAREILSIPVSTVASEASFSAGGRVVSDKRCGLSPETVEALVCLKDWNLADTRRQEAEQEAELAEAFERLKLERPEWMPRSPPHDQQSTTSR